MIRIAAIGECMIELQDLGEGLSRRTFGGDTLNMAIYVARSLPAGNRVSYVTALGEDPFSEEMLGFIDAQGVDCSLVARLPDRLPGLYVITLKDGERSFWFWRGQSAARELLRAPNFGTIREALKDYDALYFSGITLGILDDTSRAELLQMLAAARRAGAMVAFDTNYRPALWSSPEQARHWVNQALDVASHALPTHGDEALLFGDASPETTLQRVAAHGMDEVVVKDGAEPCLILAAGRRHAVLPSERVVAVDTTAAGDSFNGAYLAARLSGRDAPEAACLAHRMAGHVIRHKGAIVPPLAGDASATTHP